MKIFKYLKQLFYTLFNYKVVYVRNIISHQPNTKVIRITFIISSNFVIDPISATFLELERNKVIFKAINTFRVGLLPCSYDNILKLYDLKISIFTKPTAIDMEVHKGNIKHNWFINMDLITNNNLNE